MWAFPWIGENWNALHIVSKVRRTDNHASRRFKCRLTNVRTTLCGGGGGGCTVPFDMTGNVEGRLQILRQLRCVLHAVIVAKYEKLTRVRQLSSVLGKRK